MKKIIYIVGVLLFLVLISLAISSSLNNFEKVQEDEILIIPINGIISNSGGGNIFESVQLRQTK